MARFPRLVVPGVPHHVTQRGIRKKRTFFKALDYLTYLELVREYKEKAGIEIWAYCLMPNHIHMIVVPRAGNSLAKLFGPVHCQYAVKVNATHGWQGHLWQQRFYSVAMDEPHTYCALRYVELNPVRAGLCKKASQWRWSSVHPHLGTRNDDLVDVEATRQIVADWPSYLSEVADASTQDMLRKHTLTGRPVGSDAFIDMLEKRTGVTIRKRKTGPRKRN